MPDIPREKTLDSTMQLAADGYEFISKRCDALGTDLFEARILLQRTICMRGPEAAKLFYDEDRFTRVNAAPKRLQRSLFGVGGVQGTDGADHRHRKAMFMQLMTAERVRELGALSSDAWLAAIDRWARRREIVLLDEVQELLCRAVCAWAGVPLSDREAPKRAKQLGAMIEGSVMIGPRYTRGRRARIAAERWIARLVREVRTGERRVADGRALAVIAKHRELDGSLLDERIAAVEVLNVLRPTVAVARFIVFAALAMHDYADCRIRLAERDDEYRTWFTQEVRRFYPFFPLVAARVRRDFEWNGYAFREGTRVFLDLYGTNRDRRVWGDPEVFRPERFRDRTESAFDLIPQGGGDHFANHRCAGEWITIELIRVATQHLTESMTYEVAPQRLRWSHSRIPPRPPSGFVVRSVRATSDARRAAA